MIMKQRYELQKNQNETMIVRDNSINNDIYSSNIKLQNENLAKMIEQHIHN